MKKLIALSAAAVMASSAAMADIALSGSASVSYDDGGPDAVSATTYDASVTITGTSGGSTLTASYDLEADEVSAIDLTTTIGPVTVTADIWDEVSIVATDDNEGGQRAETDDTSLVVSLDVPVGGVTLSLDDDGDVTATASVAGVTITHTMSDGDDTTSASASIAGIDVTVENDEGDTSWSLATTVSGVAMTLDSDNNVSATMGLAGNTLTVSHTGAVAEVAEDATHYSTAAADAYTSIAVTRDLTSGATLTATYSTSDDSLTLEAAVSF